MRLLARTPAASKLASLVLSPNRNRHQRRDRTSALRNEQPGHPCRARWARPVSAASPALELQGRSGARASDGMTKAAQVFWDVCAAIAEGLGSEDADHLGKAMAVMLDGLLLHRLAHPPRSQDVVAASVGCSQYGSLAAGRERGRADRRLKPDPAYGAEIGC